MNTRADHGMNEAAAGSPCVAGFQVRYGMGITRKIASVAWVVTLLTLVVFVTMIIPEQKRIFLENLESKGRGIAASLEGLVASAAVGHDYTEVTMDSRSLLLGDPAIKYLVLSRKDGYSLIFKAPNGEWSDQELPAEWHPETEEPKGGIAVVPLLGMRAYQYSKPLAYSGIKWGWAHVGLSLDGYDRSVRRAYGRTIFLAVICAGIGLVVSLAYASKLVRPILCLQAAVKRVATGDLSARAEIRTSDEIESLAGSFNAMTQALLGRDRILQSVRFAAQRFLSTPDWRGVINEVLATLGQAAGASRVYVFQNVRTAEGKEGCSHLFEWCAQGISPQIQNTELQAVSWEEAGFKEVAAQLERGLAWTATVAELPEPSRGTLASQGIRSLVLVPVTVDGRGWGFLGLDECGFERRWTEAEIDSLRAAADMLGAAIAQQKTRDDLVVAKEAAETASRAKSQFLANMSHEIRTPITGVMGMLHLLRRTELQATQTRYVTNAMASSEALLTVIGDVLDFSKIEAGRLELEDTAFSVRETLDSAVRVFAGKAEQKGIELFYQLDEGLPESLRGDPNRLRQVLINLVGNAVKFTERGQVFVLARVEGERGGGLEVRFEVHDTGCGITRENQGRIFEAFSQADNSMSRVHGGTGLGLTISRELAQLMGGAIGVQSEPGQGSVFWFTAVLGRDRTTGETPEAVRDLRGLRVLVADDCLAVRDLVCAMVDRWRGTADGVADGAEALVALRQAAGRGEGYQVAVVDWRMPAMDGAALARAIAEDPVLARTRLVLMSGFSQAQEGLASGRFAAIVTKPARSSDLYDALMVAVNGPRNGRGGEGRGTSGKPVGTGDEGGGEVGGVEAGVGEGERGGAPRILLAEDNEINREVAMEMLADLGFQVVWAANGRQALDRARQEDVDLVLMDCQMPEMDGYEATRALRRWEAEMAPRSGRKRLTVVALTAHAMKGDRERCLEAGMDDYLTKPLDPEALERTLGQWLSWKRRQGMVEARGGETN